MWMQAKRSYLFSGRHWWISHHGPCRMGGCRCPSYEWSCQNLCNQASSSACIPQHLQGLHRYPQNKILFPGNNIHYIAVANPHFTFFTAQISNAALYAAVYIREIIPENRGETIESQWLFCLVVEFYPTVDPNNSIAIYDMKIPSILVGVIRILIVQVHSMRIKIEARFKP